MKRNQREGEQPRPSRKKQRGGYVKAVAIARAGDVGVAGATDEVALPQLRSPPIAKTTFGSIPHTRGETLIIPVPAPASRTALPKFAATAKVPPPRQGRAGAVTGATGTVGAAKAITKAKTRTRARANDPLPPPIARPPSIPVGETPIIPVPATTKGLPPRQGRTIIGAGATAGVAAEARATRAAGVARAAKVVGVATVAGSGATAGDTRARAGAGASIADRVGADLKFFSRLSEAQSFISSLHNSDDDGDGERRIFAFDKSSGLNKGYLVGNIQEIFQFWNSSRHGSKYLYELLPKDAYQRIYYDSEFYTETNADLDADICKKALHHYMRITYEEIPNRPIIVAPFEDSAITVETCHREEKMSFHGKLKHEYGLLFGMKDQRAFWARVIQHVIEDLERNDPSSQEFSLASSMKVNAKNDKSGSCSEWFWDRSVYQDSGSQLMRCLGSSKHPSKDNPGVCNFLLPENGSLEDVTKDVWIESLIITNNKAGDSRPQYPILELPKAWYKLSEIIWGTKGKPNKNYYLSSSANNHVSNNNHFDNSHVKESYQRVIENHDDPKLKNLLAKTLEEIDPKWSGIGFDDIQVNFLFYNEMVSLFGFFDINFVL
jgi:hypothetical protein